MKTIIFYFSATGNSLTTARMLARELDHCQLVGLASLKDQDAIVVEADAVGFVFPIYYSDMPHIMRRVIGKMEFVNHPYFFSVCTCRGHYGEIAQRLDTLLAQKGQKLSFSRHVPLPGNSRVSTPEQNIQMLAAQEENIQKILQELKTWPWEDHHAAVPPEKTPVHDASNMRGLVAEDHCIGCGICVKVCPMDNIMLQNDRAILGNNCCTCLSCFHWCPQKAIWMPKGEEEMKRRFQYHHPEVKLSDILQQKKQ